ncbi:hypothetical protein LOF13_01210 [Klebsiella pneumoniae subsp. pneumoniae]|nr:hypothetical protein LOF13_01210 [Klebsiella pneumoniae subsp. pneumoniae]
MTTSQSELPPHERYSGKRPRPWPRCCNSGCRRKPMKMWGLLEVALARLQLAQPEASARLAAVTLLGHSADPETQALLIPLPMPSMSRMRRCARRPAIACKRSNIVCCSAICWARPLWGCRWDRCCCWPRWGWRSPTACWG